MRGIETCFQGKVQRDPTQRYTQDGKLILGFSVGVDDPDETSKWPQWVNVSMFGKPAEELAQNEELRGGVSVLVEGWVKSPRVYVDKQGEHRASLDVTATVVDVIGMHGRPGRTPRDVMDKAPMAGQAGSNLLTDDAIPF